MGWGGNGKPSRPCREHARGCPQRQGPYYGSRRCIRDLPVRRTSGLPVSGSAPPRAARTRTSPRALLAFQALPSSFCCRCSPIPTPTSTVGGLWAVLRRRPRWSLATPPPCTTGTLCFTSQRTETGPTLCAGVCLFRGAAVCLAARGDCQVWSGRSRDRPRRPRGRQLCTKRTPTTRPAGRASHWGGRGVSGQRVSSKPERELRAGCD